MKMINLTDKRQAESRQGDGARTASCGCSAGNSRVDDAATSIPRELAGIASGFITTPVGPVLSVSTRWTKSDLWGEIKSRLSSFRMTYTVTPGLYAVGKPDEHSDVMVSANYKLSFDTLRRELKGMNSWVLVIDTAGINVWCAAGKGTFGTDELSKRIAVHGLDRVVSHRRIIVPQLGAPGVDASEVKRRTGFRIHYGPVRASDLQAYVAGGYRATPEMRTVKFTFRDRFVLTPIEVIPALKTYALIAVAMLLLFGLDSTGIVFRKSWSEGMPMVTMGFAAVLAGAFVTPVMLPAIPLRSFALKGLAVGAAVTAILIHGAGAVEKGNDVLMAFSYIFFSTISSYLALQFTGATTFTGIHGVKKELKYAIPLYVIAMIASIVLLVIHKVMNWGAV